MDIDLLKIPKYKLMQYPAQELLNSLDLLTSSDLERVYMKLLGKDGCLLVKGNAVLLKRRIAYFLQEQMYGKLSTRHYNQLYSSTRVRPRDTYEVPIGSLITKDWQGQRYTVEVVSGGYIYNEKTYKSLSKIAKLITGHERSGPAFFGVRKAGKSHA